MSAPRRTPDEVRDALIDALIRLLADRPVDAISVRDIAAEAGVNHGLVHRYFGSKELMVHAAVRRLSDQIHQGLPGHPGMSAPTFNYLRAHPHLARLMARACLDGPQDLLADAAPSEERLNEIVAPIRDALERGGVEGVDPHTLNGLAVAAFLGWFTFRPLLERAFRVGPNAEDEIGQVLELIDLLVAARPS